MEMGSDEEEDHQIRSVADGGGGGGGSSNNKKKNKIDNSSSSSAKPKRQMKTPFQLETLEKVYSEEKYPSEATRADLSDKLNLTDRQLQMWFCHRRLKDKKDDQSLSSKTPVKSAVPAVRPPPPALASSVNDLPPSRSVPEQDSGSGSDSGSGCSPYSDSRRNFASGSSSSRAELDEYETMGKPSYEPRLSAMVRRAIVCIEAQLGEPLRDDGPILGMEFDPLPPGAFGTPIAMQKHLLHPYESKMYEPHDVRPRRSQAAARSFHEQQSLDDPSSFTPEVYGRYSENHAHGMDYEIAHPRSSSFMHENGSLPRSYGTPGYVSRNCSTSQQDMPSPIVASAHRGDRFLMEKDSSVLGTEDPYMLSDGVRKSNDVHRKGKIHDVRLGRGSETRENRGPKDLEKLEIQKKKNEERMRKEMERNERERRKEEERLMRERIKEEERLQREQRREMERREKFLQRENERAEKKKQKEEIRREKDAIRRKIAIEKATARRIAKESMDLIEDEQLELMELAAISKGLPSVLQLDHDTLQNLELYRDSLSTFPPKGLQLKMPFAISPWKDSDESVGNLLMVWRFLTSFSDVLDLWPFTLDEFIQAFHDYDSRLLGEIHVTLLRSIIRDIEDVARTPFSGIGNNQYTTANPEGGHPQIVEGAYAWGFDIRSWKKNLNSLTWPEVLRQLALSTGLGPRLKKKNSRLTHTGDKDEAKGCEDIISTIRSGSAAESAFALMREKGLLAPRKSRHRLTPGTVKFAAFHVLSLEGSKGLTVLELADKIQKSGLRDLTTSKTPEASISVALTRDVKLFERIAPSTYCVRAPYVKDPADGETILADARKKIRAFESGLTGPEDVNDLERDEDFEIDIDEDPEVDDLATLASASKTADLGEANILSGKGGDTMFCDVKAGVKSEIEKEFSSPLPSSIKSIVPQHNERLKDTAVGCVDAMVDESNEGQSWIQGLTEGDYCHLSVEERLNALVALVGIANEGNSIRAGLEDRMEAANSLKKQMWAEAQLDNSCMRDVLKLDFQNLANSKTESTMGLPIIQSSNREKDNFDRDPSELLDETKPLEVVSNDLRQSSADRGLINQESNISQENCSFQQGYASKRSRSQLKSYIGHKAEEVYPYRSLPVGQDRRHNRYWLFAASASKSDPSSGLLFVELHDGKWLLIDSEEAFDTLVASLDMRGIRESHLRIMLQKIEGSFKENARKNMKLARNPFLKEKSVMNHSPTDSVSPSSAVSGSNSDSMETSNSIRVELGRNDTEKKSLSKRFHDFQRWMWTETYSSLPSCARKYGKKRSELLATCALCVASYLSEYTHCTSCHQRLDMVNGSEILDLGLTVSPLPFGVRLLKPLLVFLEASIPDEALESFWTEDKRKMWGFRLNASSSPEELLQVLTTLETAIKKEYLSSNFMSAKELLGVGDADADTWGSVDVLPWIPKTVSAVALRLSELDASIIYVKPEKPDLIPEDENEQISLFPGDSLFKGKGPREQEDQDEVVPNLGNRRSNKRARVSLGSGSNKKVKRKKAQGGPNRFVVSRRNVAVDNNLMSMELNHQIPGRGKRTVRKRPERINEDNDHLVNRMADIVRPKTQEIEEDEEEEEQTFRDIDEDWAAGETPREMDEDWANETPNRMMTPMQVDDESDNSVGVESEDDDVDGQFVDYSQRNKWGLDWNSNANEAAMEDEEEEEVVGVERVEGEDDAEMSESSEDDDDDVPANNAANNYDRESEGGYSSSDS
ncbi:PREDICTED: homeobox-DDT domain protein RLT1 isoform X1 [Camelina sativa]|uniref:Homeobox-DDT domain protein RLT1 isoform X1 n=1 Tax=Camelina sativa TaxID=90675 RepID=A0ABM0WZ18_CAMSA|nr:PREDICTED: homeobox-DDT domain protein RLT1 isoform X1 [Camelina sativa]